jgi:hypothetical protein
VADVSKVRATITLTCHSDVPRALVVGDEIGISGKAVVQSVAGEVVDVSSPGGYAYALGEFAVNMIAGEIQVEAL